MSLVAAVVAGGLLGVRHAVETDHVAAVAALVDGDSDHPGLVGVSWGVGHSLPVAAVGLSFLLLGVEFPDLLFTLVEGVVGVLLVVLGGRLLATELVRLRHGHDDTNEHTHLGVGSLLFGATHTHRATHGHEHAHGEEETHAHHHTHGDGHTHPWLAGDARDDPHDAESALDHGGFAVGAVHGLAGSGALVVALVAAAPAVEHALAFLGAFSVGSVATMAGVAAVWGRTLETRGRRVLTLVAGLVGVVVGVGLLAEVVGLTTFVVG